MAKEFQVASKEAIAAREVVNDDPMDTGGRLASALEKLASKLDGPPREDGGVHGRLNALENALSPGRIVVQSGELISVSRGDFIGYFPLKGGSGIARGGWFKVDKEQKVDASGCVRVSIAASSFQYDKTAGAPYHSVQHRPYKKYTQAEGEKIVGHPTLLDTPQSVSVGPMAHWG